MFSGKTSNVSNHNNVVDSSDPSHSHQCATNVDGSKLQTISQEEGASIRVSQQAQQIDMQGN
jgi:hypothetical protein